MPSAAGHPAAEDPGRRPGEDELAYNRASCCCRIGGSGTRTEKRKRICSSSAMEVRATKIRASADVALEHLPPGHLPDELVMTTYRRQKVAKCRNFKGTLSQFADCTRLIGCMRIRATCWLRAERAAAASRVHCARRCVVCCPPWQHPPPDGPQRRGQEHAAADHCRDTRSDGWHSDDCREGLRRSRIGHWLSRGL